jgi:hypothetical protein
VAPAGEQRDADGAAGGGGAEPLTHDTSPPPARRRRTLAGTRQDPCQARLGFAAAVALRWSFLAGALRELLAGAPHVQHPSHGEPVSTAAAVRQWVRLIGYVLD